MMCFAQQTFNKNKTVIKYITCLIRHQWDQKSQTNHKAEQEENKWLIQLKFVLSTSSFFYFFHKRTFEVSTDQINRMLWQMKNRSVLMEHLADDARW